MTKRYFYTDPLAAAWMAKHFGMELLTDLGIDGLVDAGARFIDCEDRFSELWQHDFFYLGRLYIHPDSLHLLEPQEWDIVENDGVEFGIVTHVLGDEAAIQYCEDSDGDVLCGALPIKNLTIIQRNGIHFMWPESEEEA